MFDLPRIMAETHIRWIEYHVELPSTNDFALKEQWGQRFISDY